MEVLHFLKEATGSMREVGAIWPSGQELQKAIVTAASVDTARAVVELGPGTGVFSRHIVKNIPPETFFLMIEINDRFCQTLQQAGFSDYLVQGNATNVDAILQEKYGAQCDVVVSGLPFAQIQEEIQIRILKAVYKALEPGGKFITFSYIISPFLKKGKIFRSHLQDIFGKDGVEISPVIWKNIPPAFLYTAQK